MSKNSEIEMNKRALSMLPRGWTVERGADMLDGDGNRKALATANFYVLDTRTDNRGNGETIIDAVADAIGVSVSSVRNYACRKPYTAEDIARLADEALNVMCKHVQDAIGQTDGGIAGHFWSGENAALIRAYVETEIMNRDEE